ncbi:hypothetical protein CHS0354_000023 [Potamilus streckersoni]|uniref:THD domain-containing protein n=1 Tax=Potamilus streckersoni TaxID=2493646 RepID=A0AAE0TIA1_9BIVA|nr:hypothetical protein CHS0354_000023 [Potamilus streckersoni]
MKSSSHREHLLITSTSEHEKHFNVERKQVEVVTSPGKTQVLITALCISVICNVLAVVFLAYKEILLKSGAGAQTGHCASLEKNNVCLPCSSKEQFSLTSGETRDIKWVTLCSDEKLCCFESFELLSRLTQIFSLNHTAAQIQREGDTERRPAAHVYIDVNQLKNDTLAWSLGDGYNTAFLVNGVEMVKASLQVPEAGDYFVYSFITFKSPPSRVAVTPSPTFGHYVQRENSALPLTGKQLLLMNRKSRPEGDFSFQSSFLSAVLRLRRHDRISTGVSEINSIYMATMSNFMGLYRV